MALGAQRARVVRMIIRDGAPSIVSGLILGLVAVVAMARLMTGLLYGVDPTDLPTFIAVTACLSAIAFFGCLIPGLKAAMIDPAIALRAE